jgi:hypothetical protein
MTETRNPTAMTTFVNWLYANDWRMFAAFVATQVVLVSGFILFAFWISDYARLNWY